MQVGIDQPGGNPKVTKNVEPGLGAEIEILVVLVRPVGMERDVGTAEQLDLMVPPIRSDNDFGNDSTENSEKRIKKVLLYFSVSLCLCG